MNILTDVMSLLKRKKYVEVAKPDDVLVLGIHEEPEILGIASPIPYKDVKLIKIKDLAPSGACTHINVPELSPSYPGVFKGITTIDEDCFVNLRRLKSLSLDLTIVENGDFIEFDLTGDLDLVIANTLTVTKSGDDTTAAALTYDFHNPWLNPTVAMAAAVSGDVVVVYPGVYQIGTGGLTDDGSQQMVRDGVILYMMPGAVIQYTNVTGTTSLPFTDGGTAQTFTIRGKGDFIFDADISVTSNFLVTTHASTVVDWEFNNITINKLWGGGEHDCAKWRMVGKGYYNNQSAFFSFEYPAESINRIIEIDIEEIIFTHTYAPSIDWTKQFIENLSTGSVVNIHYGRVQYPHTRTGGAFHHVHDCFGISYQLNPTINLTIDSLYRSNSGDTYDEYIVFHEKDHSDGIYTINNIVTARMLVKCLNASTPSDSIRVTNLTGYMFNDLHHSPWFPLGVYIIHNENCVINQQFNLNIKYKQNPTTGVRGILLTRCPNTVISGLIDWQPVGYSPTITIRDNTTTAGRLHNLVIANMPVLSYSIQNDDVANDVNIKIINVFATITVDATTAFSVVQLISTMVIDTDV